MRLAPRILGVEPSGAGECVVPMHVGSSGRQAIGQCSSSVAATRSAGVSLQGRRERLLYAVVQLLLSAPEPHVATGAQRIGLVELPQAENLAEEPVRLSSRGYPRS